MLSLQKNTCLFLLMCFFILGGAAFEGIINIDNKDSKFGVYAARKSKKKSKKKTEKREQKTEEKEDDSDYLTDSDEAKEYIAEIFRCAECGYEQDEPGTCPDHSTNELIKITDKARDPLAPVEYDGNEDIIVDIPLKDVKFRKEQLNSEEEKDKDKGKDKEKKEDKNLEK